MLPWRLKMDKDTFSFDVLYREVLLPRFAAFEDKRRHNSLYSQSEALKSGFALYSLKSPSLYSFRQYTKAEEHNMAMIYELNHLPSDNGLRMILYQVDSQELRKSFGDLYNWASTHHALEAFRSWEDHLIISIDGVEYFTSKQVSCPHCLVRRH